MLYALISPENQIDRTHDFIDFEIPNTKEGWRWIPVEADPRPPYNLDTQVVNQIEVVEETRVYRYWELRDKYDYEIESDKIQKINAIDPTIIKALLDLYNQINNSSLTIEEYKAHLKSIL